MNNLISGTLTSQKLLDFIFPDPKNFFCYASNSRTVCYMTYDITSAISDKKNEVIPLGRSRDQLRTNLKNFENPTHPKCFLNKFLFPNPAYDFGVKLAFPNPAHDFGVKLACGSVT